jgi:endonuclease IV
MAEQKQVKPITGTVGVHVDRRDKGKTGIEASIRAALVALPGSRCCQIFTHGPKGRAMNKFNTEDLRDLCHENRIYVHSTYFTTWKNVEHMQEQFTCAATLAAQGVVLHLVKIRPEEHIEVLNQLRISDVRNPDGTRRRCLAILEMQAFKSVERDGSPVPWTYQTADEVNKLCEALEKAGWGPDRAIICLDTAHLDAGRIPLRTAADAKKYIDALRYPDYIGLLHLNGNAYNCMERARDKHCVPHSSDDWIWHKSREAGDQVSLEESGTRTLVDWFISRGRDVILEQDFTPELVSFYKELTQ